MKNLLDEHNIPIIVDSKSDEDYSKHIEKRDVNEKKNKQAARKAKIQERKKMLKEKKAARQEKRASKLVKKKDFKRDITEDQKQKQLELKAKLEEHKKKIQEKRAKMEEKRDKKLAELKANLSNRIKRMAVINIPLENENDETITTESSIQDLTCPVNFTDNNPLLKEPLILVAGKPIDNTKLLLDEKKREDQLEKLKQRLAMKKRLEERKAKYYQALEERKMKSFNPLIDVEKRSIEGLPFWFNNLNSINKINEISNDIEKSDEKILFNDIIKEGSMLSNFDIEHEDEPYKIVIPELKMYKAGQFNIEKKTSTTTEKTTTTTISNTINKESTQNIPGGKY